MFPVLAPVFAATLSIATSATVAVPFRQFNGIVVFAKINGRGPLPFIVDTGASVVVLTPDTLARVAAGSVRHSDTASGMSEGSIDVSDLKLESVSIGNALAQGVDAGVVHLPRDLTYLGHHLTAAGIIGMSFLRHFAVTVDYQHEKLTLQRTFSSQTFQRTLQLALLDNSDGLPVIQGRINGHSGTFLVDTGNLGNTVLTSAFARASLGSAGRTAFSTTRTALGGGVSSISARADTIELGGFRERNVPVEIASTKHSALDEAHLSGNLGYRFVRRFRMLFAFAQKRLFLAPIQKRDPVFEASAGISTTRNADGTLQVLQVREPATSAGLRRGDTIISINGTAVATLGGQECADRLHGMPGAETNVVVERSKRMVPIRLVFVGSRRD